MAELGHWSDLLHDHLGGVSHAIVAAGFFKSLILKNGLHGYLFFCRRNTCGLVLQDRDIHGVAHPVFAVESAPCH